MATQAEIAGHLDLSRTAVADLLQRGILPTAKPGQLELDECRVAYLRHLRKQAAGQGSSSLTDFRSQVERERAAKLKRENELAQKEIIQARDVVAGEQTVFAYVRSKLLAVPTKAAPAVVIMEKVGDIKEHLTELIYDALEELSRTRVVAVPEGAGGADDGEGADRKPTGVQAAAKTNRKRVGGRKPNAKRGVKRGAREVGNGKGGVSARGNGRGKRS